MRTIGILCSALVVLFVAASSQAGYILAINANIGSVSGEIGTTATPSGILAQSWNNATLNASSHGAISTDGYGGTWASPPVTTAGVAATGFHIRVENGGWGYLSTVSGGGAAGTLLETVVRNDSDASPWGDPVGWNTYITWSALPAAFDNYDVWALHTVSGSYVWEKVASGLTVTAGSANLDDIGRAVPGRNELGTKYSQYVGALQFTQLPEPATMALLGLGGLGLLLNRKRK